MQNEKVQNISIMSAKIKLLFLLFAISILFIFVGCEKDVYEDNIINEHRMQTEYVTGNDAKLLISKLKKTLKKKYTLSDSNIEGRLTLESIGTILYDEIVKITDSTGNSTYTFKVDRPDNSFSKFYNLILQESNQGNLIKLMEYKMTDEFAQQFMTSFNYSNFRGTLTTYTIINDTPCSDQDVILFAVGNVPIPTNGGNGGLPPNGTPTNPPPSGPGPILPGIPGGTYGGTGGTGGTGGSSGAPPSALTIAAYIEMVIECIGSGGTWNNATGSCFLNPRNFRMAVPNTIDPGIEPCNPVTYVVVITPESECERAFLQNSPFLNWIGQHTGDQQYSNIMNYINGDGSGNCSTDREDFVDEMINAIVNDSCTVLNTNVFDNQITTILPPCLENVINDLKTLQNGKFGKVISQFAGTNPVPLNYNWHVISGPMSATTIAGTNPTVQNGIATTTINSNYINISTNLSIAKTLIHECFHAYLVSVYRYRNIDKSYVNLLNQYAAQFNNIANDIHHHAFTLTNVVSEISIALKEYGVSQGYNLPQQFYDDMAWGGLYGTQVYNALPQSQRERIESTIEAEFTNSNNSPNNILGLNPNGVQICP